MSLSKEWNNRIAAWLVELRGHFYEPLGEIALDGFVTFERLDPATAGFREFRPMPAGTAWGAKWEYAWFKGELALPAEAAGKRVVGARIVARLEPGLEGLVFVNGAAAGAVDREHREITLARRAKGGESYSILAEFYAGHGPIEENCGPVPPGFRPIPETAPTQRTVAPSTWGTWDDEAFALWIDAETLYQTRAVLPEASLRVSEIDAGLEDFSRIVDFELPADAMRDTFRNARARLRPLLECVNGSTAPEMFAFGNSHLDLAWQWPREETVRKSARTMSTQLALLEEYPEYGYLLCQVPLFEMLRDGYPELWARTKARIAEGSVKAEGGMWLEPDTNLPCGEALIRQVALAKEFFRDELGADTRLLWLPDTFGFSAALPQIMRGTGLEYFATKKLIDNYSGGDPFPYTTFRWKGLDGSEVLAHVYRKCNSPIDPNTLAKRWNADRVQKDGISTYLFPFGYGDGGGGATREMLEFARRLGDLEGNPKVRMSGPIEFFEDLESRGRPFESYVGELYFQEHRGTYTTQGRTKRANRKAEIALRDAELWSAFAGVLVDSPWPKGALRGAWRGLLSSHFHDVIAGVSIARVHEEALAELEAVAARSRELRDAALAGLAGAGGECVRVYNSLSWERTELVLLPKDAPALVDAEGKAVPAQAAPEGLWVEATIPACGWTSLAPGTSACGGFVSIRADGDGYVLENDFLRARVDRAGRVPSFVDKVSGLEVAAAPCNDFRLYKDVNSNYDAWDIESLYRGLPVELGEGDATIEVAAEGPLFVALRLRRRLAASDLAQEIKLARGSRRLEFHTAIDWREDHKLLKVSFPTNLRADDALYEIQFGHVRRPTHRNRRFDADRFEGCQHRWTALAETGRGAAVLNDCKYGSDVAGGTISLTLLKAPFVPDMGADRGRHEFAYAFMAWSGDFASMGPVREGYAFNVPPTVSTGGAGARSLLGLDEPSVILETAKLAEDGSGDLVLRLYESSGRALRCALRLGFPCAAARAADMLESEGAELPIAEGTAALEFRAFEIKTLRFRLEKGLSR